MKRNRKMRGIMRFLTRHDFTGGVTIHHVCEAVPGAFWNSVIAPVLRRL